MIVNCVSYREGERVGEIPIEDISEALAQPNAFVWLGLHELELSLLLKVQEEFGLHELAIEDAQSAHQLPKMEVYGESIFIVVKTIHLEQGKLEVGETHFFVGKNYIVSIRHGRSLGYAPIRAKCEYIPKMLKKGPGFALYALMDFIVDCYQPVMGQFEAEFEKLEHTIFNGQFDRMAIGHMYDLKSQILHVRNAILPMDDICNQLMHFHEDIIPKELRAYYRDIKDHVSKVINMTDSMREMLSTAMQVHLGIVAIGQNDIVKRLAGWGAILAIPTVVFSLYGMNFTAMPELKSSYGYPIVLIFTIFCCFCLYRKLNHEGWL